MESEKILARPVSGELARVGSTLTVAMQMETNYLPQLANRPTEAFHAHNFCIYPTRNVR